MTAQIEITTKVDAGTNADIARILHSRYCSPGREDIRASSSGGLDKHVMRAEGWTFDREIAPNAGYFASWLELGRWDVIDREIGKHFQDTTWRDPAAR